MTTDTAVTVHDEADEPSTTGPARNRQTTPDASAIVWVDPAELLVDRNVREARLTKAFVASIKTHGLIEPVTVVRTTDDTGVPRLRVRTGHRRTLAAIAAGRSPIPAYVTGDDHDSTDTAGEARRIVTQFVENEQRAALSTAERAAAVEQLTLLGLSAGQISARTTASKADVTAALAVAGSDVARAAADRWEFLTLGQSAALAEFDQPTATDERGVTTGGRDDEAITALVAAAQEGPVQFARALDAARAAAADRRAREQVAGPLRAAGITVLDREPRWTDTTVTLDGLYDPADPAGTPLTAEAHAACPGHVAWLLSEWERADGHDPADPDSGPSQDDGDDEDGWVVVYRAVLGCTDPRTHGHADRRALARGGSTTAGSAGASGDADALAAADAEREAKRRERREVIGNNKAMDAATPIRREWVRALLARKSAPKGTAAFLADALATGRSASRDATPAVVAALFGQPEGSYFDASKAAALATDTPTETRALVVALGVALAGYEAQVDRTAWRQKWPQHRTYFTFLEANGYPLSDVEVLAAGRKPKRGKATTPNA